MAVLAVDASTGAGSRANARASAKVSSGRERPDPAAAISIEGTVKWFKADKGFGFVVCDDGQKDVSIVERAGLRGPIERSWASCCPAPISPSRLASVSMKVCTGVLTDARSGLPRIAVTVASISVPLLRVMDARRNGASLNGNGDQLPWPAHCMLRLWK